MLLMFGRGCEVSVSMIAAGRFRRMNWFQGWCKWET
jgi:hypothetical protein